MSTLDDIKEQAARAWQAADEAWNVARARLKDLALHVACDPTYADDSDAKAALDAAMNADATAADLESVVRRVESREHANRDAQCW